MAFYHKCISGDYPSILEGLLKAPKNMQETYIYNTLLNALTNKYLFGIIPGMRYTKKQFEADFPDDDACLEAITTERTTLTKTKLAKFFAAGDSLSPKDAKGYGIVTEVRELDIPGNAKKIVINTFPVPNQGNVPNALNP